MRVEYSDLSKKDFENLQDYLFDQWGILVLEIFLDKYDQPIQMLLSKNVYFEKYRDTGFMKYLVTKHNYIIYDYKDDMLRIHRVINNFQNPDDNYESISKYH